MSNNIIFIPDAQDDMINAFDWYELQQAGLGNKFLFDIEYCLQRISFSPNMYLVVYKQYHRAVVKKFPYAVLYNNQHQTIVVYGVFHTSQHPDKWLSRLDYL
ncbi:MAG: type II toxin-antitoxin system RelE/ParE family toxin [Chlorobium sp.]